MRFIRHIFSHDIINDSPLPKATLALKYHPKVCKDNPSKTYYHFCRVAESYEVLSNKRTRAFYDNWGEEKLKQGIFINEALRKE